MNHDLHHLEARFDQLDASLARLDSRLSRVENKLDGYAERTADHGQQLKQLQGMSKVLVSVFLAVTGFLALAFFKDTP